MKKLISITITFVMVMSLVLGASASAGHRDQGRPNTQNNINIKDSFDNNDDLEKVTIGTTTPGALKFKGIKSTTPGSIEFKDAMDKLKDGHRNHQLRKALLKELKDLWKGKGIEDGITIIVNGNVINVDVPPVIKGNRTLIPVRAVTEALGAKVSWDPATPTKVVITKTVNNVLITVKIDLVTGEIRKWVGTDLSGAGEVVVAAKAETIKNRTMVPIRVLAEIFGMDVEYDEGNHGVFVDEDGDSSSNNGEGTNKLDTTPPALVFTYAEATSANTITLTFNEEMKSSFSLRGDDIIVTDGTHKQYVTYARVSSTTPSAIVLKTSSLDGYTINADPAKTTTTITINAGEFRDKAGNAYPAADITLPVVLKYSK